MAPLTTTSSAGTLWTRRVKTANVEVRSAVQQQVEMSLNAEGSVPHRKEQPAGGGSRSPFPVIANERLKERRTLQSGAVLWSTDLLAFCSISGSRYPSHLCFFLKFPVQCANFLMWLHHPLSSCLLVSLPLRDLTPICWSSVVEWWITSGLDFSGLPEVCATPSSSHVAADAGNVQSWKCPPEGIAKEEKARKQKNSKAAGI